VLIEHGAGFQAQFPAHDYEAAGATIVNASRVWHDSDIVLKVRPPRLRSTTLSPNNFIQVRVKITIRKSAVMTDSGFVQGFREGGVLISILQPNVEKNRPVVNAMVEKKASHCNGMNPDDMWSR
jgi:NAD(P) transhydrogenase